MKVRIYKQLLNGKETMDSYTIWLKPTKKAAKTGAIINCLCCNAIGNKVWGYWEDYPANTRIGLDIFLGKRLKESQIPEPILKHAKELEKVFYKACETGDWDKWNKL